MTKKPIILGIETSCDETAVAVIQENKQDTPQILSSIVSSQVDIHKEFGGVVPELASRDHVRKIIPLIEKGKIDVIFLFFLMLNAEILKTNVKSGINNFDIASIKEIEDIRKISPKAKCSYMHTVKSRENINEAYFKFGVKTFSLDSKDELIKIIESTNHAKDLELFVRVSVSNEHAEIDLSKKFGAQSSEASSLLRPTKQYSKKIGLSFHVGSQCMHPISYAKGITDIGNIIKKTKIIPNYINIGGGFPTIYPDLVPQSLDNYFEEIKKGLKNLKLDKLPEILCEPGRAIVAESGSTIVRVNLRKKQNSKMIILNYPNNPTGKILPRKLLDSIIQTAKEHDLYVLSDEIYSDYTFSGLMDMRIRDYEKTIITQIVIIIFNYKIPNNK